MVKFLQHQFKYQPAGWSAFIFWGSLGSVLALAIVLQWETVGLSWFALILTLACVIMAAYQILRLRATITADTLILQRLTRSNTLTIPLKGVTITQTGNRRLHLTGTHYGDLDITTWQPAATILSQLTVNR